MLTCVRRWAEDGAARRVGGRGRNRVSRHEGILKASSGNSAEAFEDMGTERESERAGVHVRIRREPPREECFGGSYVERRTSAARDRE